MDGLWVPVCTSIREHPKLIRLANMLRVHKVQALGHLVALWTWAQMFATDGDLSNYTADEIAAGAWWDGEPEVFVNALKTAGFLDADGKLHDWVEYGGKLHEQREKTRERVARYRARKEPDNHDGCNGCVTVTSPLRNTNVTGQNRIEKNRIEENRIHQCGAADAAPGAASAAPSSSSSSSFPEIDDYAEAIAEYKKLNLDERYTFLARNVKLCESAAEMWRKLESAKRDQELFYEDDDAWSFFCEAANLEEACAAYMRATNKKQCTIAEREYLNAIIASIRTPELDIIDCIVEAAASTDNVNLKYIAAIARKRADVDWEPVGPLRRI